jgi:transcription elongation factor Elf1
MSAVKRMQAADKKWWCLFCGKFNLSTVIECDE